MLDDISGRGTTRHEGDEQLCGDWPEGVKASGSQGGRGLVGSAKGKVKVSVRFAVGGKSKYLVFEHYPSPIRGVRGLGVIW